MLRLSLLAIMISSPVFRLSLSCVATFVISVPGFAAPAMETAPHPEELPLRSLSGMTPAQAPEVTWTEPATSLDHVILDVSPGYDVLQSDVHVRGGTAFHLAHPPDPEPQIIELAPDFSGSSETHLFFESRLGYAATAQVARVQISTGTNDSWSDIWIQEGTNDAGEGSFFRQSIDLSAFEGETYRLRFVYDFEGNEFFPQTDPGVGWYIDDIRIASDFETRLYSIGDPTDEEQLFLEFINRARAGAVEEAWRLRETEDPLVVGEINSFDVDLDLMIEQFEDLPPTAQPLAFNPLLTEAARLHSVDMLENIFQGHTSSSSPPSPNEPGDSPGDRVSRQGYEYSRLGENVFAHAQSVWHGHAGFNIDWGVSAETGLSVGGMQDPAGHRITIHTPDFREIGIGVVLGSAGAGGDSVGPMLVTQNFGTVLSEDPPPFITGVAWLDLEDTGFYAPGDGLGGITVTVTGASFHAVTAGSGGYAVPVPGDGAYDVTFEGEGFGPDTYTVTLSDGENVKLDYNPGAPPPVAPRIVHVSELPGEARIRIDVEAGPEQILLLETSTDLNEWTPLPEETPSQLEDGLYRFEPALAGPRRFYRIQSVSD